MDFFALTLGIIFISLSILSIFLLNNKKYEKYVKGKSVVVLFFIFGIVWIILAFITNIELGYLIFGLIFISIGVGILYLKMKNPDDKTNRITMALLYIGFGILWVLGFFI